MTNGARVKEPDLLRDTAAALLYNLRQGTRFLYARAFLSLKRDNSTTFLCFEILGGKAKGCLHSVAFWDSAQQGPNFTSDTALQTFEALLAVSCLCRQTKPKFLKVELEIQQCEF